LMEAFLGVLIMYTTRLTAGSVLCFVLALALSAKAADNPKIDSWMEGSITNIDLTKNKFTVHGAKRPYATEYSKMLNDIADKTAKLEGAAKDAKATEVRTSWGDKLNKAAAETREKDSDFNFHILAKDGTVMSYEEDQTRTTPAPDATMTKRNFSEFQVGQYVLVGYEFGVVSNEVTVIAKTTKPSSFSVNAQFKETTPLAGDPSKLPAETEQARQIRKSIIDDKSLSTAAHNIGIDMKDGVAHLKGTIPSETEKQAVEAKAAAVVGATKVVNELDVKAK